MMKIKRAEHYGFCSGVRIADLKVRRFAAGGGRAAMYKIAGELTSYCMHVAARTIATHALSIFGEHSDVKRSGSSTTAWSSTKVSARISSSSHEWSWSSSLAPVHSKQLLTYLRLMRLEVGLPINFGNATLEEGLHRVVNGLSPSASPRLRVNQPNTPQSRT